MTAEREELAARIRDLLADVPSVREIPMFGGISFMVNDKMVVAARKDGSLLVHVDPGRHEELLGYSACRQAEMGKGRTMGPGWLTVAPESLADHEQLSFWLEQGMQDRAGNT
ncbi:TfoX/Sxy family protein [Arthrobacter sp. H14]|uniref:TfoX/Sxy family protein n=1 Tax=Arthrobacter sp. H14 TaxID=1312959 RepID=UPI00047A8EFC|nr:TfoX/Sxy family protein [Arthrobacter sp. H14]